MSFAGAGSVRIVKNCDRSEVARRGQHFFKPEVTVFHYTEPTLRRQMTCLCFFSCSKLVSQIKNGFVYATLVTESACAPSTNDLVIVVQRKM